MCDTLMINTNDSAPDNGNDHNHCDDYLLADEILELINEADDNNKCLGNNNDQTLELIDDIEAFDAVYCPKTQSIHDSCGKLQTESLKRQIFGDFSDDSDDENLNENGKFIKNHLHNDVASERSKGLSEVKRKSNNWKSKPNVETHKDNVICDVYSGIRIKNPLISSHEIKSRIDGRRIVKLSLIKTQINKSSNDIEGDWITMGIVVSKLPPKVSKKGTSYSIWKLSDLKSDKLVTLFMFGDVHVQHWKLPIGSVIGLLNPKFMADERDNSKFGKKELCSLTIDHPGKLMVMGMSKDAGFCRGLKKNNEICGVLVNLAECAYCVYHTRIAYKRVSSNRAELQSSYSNIEPKQKNKFLRSDLTFESDNSHENGKLNPKRKASNATSKCSVNEHDVSTKINKSQLELKKKGECKTLEKLINSPLSVASRNLAAVNARNNGRDSMGKGNNSDIIRSAKDVLRMVSPRFDSKEKIIPSVPVFAKGYKPGQMIDLSDPKKRAAQILKAKPMEKKDPNQIKKRPSKLMLETIRKRIDNALQDETFVGKPKEECYNHYNDSKERDAKRRKRDMIETAINRKSHHDEEVTLAEAAAQEKYFSNLENKEKLETKLLSTTELECDVITCTACKYTNHAPAEHCRRNAHHFVRHKALKRFFSCRHCKLRTFTFNSLIPTKECHRCGYNSYEKTSMYNINPNPKINDDVLLIRGEEHSKSFN